jgi:hypothetical protein
LMVKLGIPHLAISRRDGQEPKSLCKLATTYLSMYVGLVSAFFHNNSDSAVSISPGHQRIAARRYSLPRPGKLHHPQVQGDIHADSTGRTCGDIHAYEDAFAVGNALDRTVLPDRHELLPVILVALDLG